MATSTTRWNAVEVLRFDPDSAGFSCVGHAKTQGRRCRNVIAYANRDEASNILKTMGELDVHTANFDNQLNSLATRSLCRRWHQDQTASKVQQWRIAIDGFRAAENTRQARPSATETSAGPQAVATPATLCSMDTLESLRREIARLNERYASVLQLATAATAGSSSSAQSNLRVVIDSETSPATQSTHTDGGHSIATSTAPSAQPEADRHVEEDGDDRNSNRRSTSRAPTSESHFAPHSPSTATETPSQPEERSNIEPRPRTITRQPIEGDCAICCQDLTDENEISWCKAQCGQNFHADCVGTWFTTQEVDGRSKTCPYCRGNWFD